MAPDEPGLLRAWDVDSDSVEQRIVEAAAVLPSYGGVTGWAALRWAGRSGSTAWRATAVARCR